MNSRNLYKLFISSFLLFTACKDKNFDNDKQVLRPTNEIVNDTPTYFVTGKPYRPTESQIIAKKYGFKFDYLGCMMTEENEKLEKDHNPKTEKILKEKFGDNFWRKFDNDLDSLGKIQDKLDSIIDVVTNQKVVKNKIYEVENKSNFQRRILFSPTLIDSSKNIYLVKVTENVGQNEKAYFKYLVNANKMKIIGSIKQ